MTKFYSYILFVTVLKPCIDKSILLETFSFDYKNIDLAKMHEQSIKECGQCFCYTVVKTRFYTIVNDIEF